jgi:soluble lytic murein transglycosylase-like protein
MRRPRWADRPSPARHRTPARLATWLLALPMLAAAATGVPELTLDGLPRPAVPPPEVGPVVPAQVLRWRQEAAALEHGDGVERDELRAAELYCRAARYGDAEAQYSLAWMLTNSRGIERNDAQAAHLFAAASEQGHPQARNMARMMGTPRGDPPACLLPPEEDSVVAAAPAPPPATAAPRAGAAPAVREFVAPPTLPPNAPPQIVRFVELVAPEYKLDPYLVLAVMATESNFDAWAVSPRNARGLMQLIPGTAARFKVTDMMDPTQNIRGGMAYLRWLLATFEGELPLALAAYNAGERAVERYRGVPPYAETRLYVRKILALLGGRRKHEFDPTAAAPSEAMPLIRARALVR